MNRTIQRLVWCSLLLAVTPVFGQEVNLLVLDAKNGRAVRNAVVWVQFYDAATNRVLQRIQSTTGPDGVARIQLPAPLPAELTLSASASSFCLGFVIAATVDIVNHGVVSRCDPKASDSPPKPSPGEVIFLIRRFPWWHRLLAPLVRE